MLKSKQVQNNKKGTKPPAGKAGKCGLIVQAWKRVNGVTSLQTRHTWVLVKSDMSLKTCLHGSWIPLSWVT